MIRSLIAASLFSVAFISMAPRQGHAEDLVFTLTNQSGYDVVGFYVSQAGSNEWEENLMEGGYLADGYEINVLIADGLTVCTYDIMVEFEDGDSIEDYGVDVCELGGYTIE